MQQALYEIIVIGAGTAGCTAALTGAEFGRDVLLVSTGDAGEPPGSEVIAFDLVREAVLQSTRARLLGGGEREKDGFACLFGREPASRRRSIIEQYFRCWRQRLASRGVAFAEGRVRFVSPRTIEVEGHGICEAPIFVISTGTHARRPAVFPFDDKVVFDSHSILHIDRPPKNLLVVGGEQPGCEYSSLFSAIGCSVTLVDRRRRLLRFLDRQLLEALHGAMQQRGVIVVLDEDIAGIEVGGSPKEPFASVTLGSGRIEHFDRVLIAAGRAPNVSSLALERAGIAQGPRDFVLVDEFARTSQPGIYAVGDVTSSWGVSGCEAYQGRLAVLHAVGELPHIAEELPVSLRTIPEVAFVGLTEEMCECLELPYYVGVVPFDQLVRARTRGETEGILKLVVGRGDRRLLGVHIIGTQARELVNLGASLMQSGASVDRLTEGTFTANSLSSAYRIAALDALAPRRFERR